MSLAALQLRDALRALETAQNTYLTAVRTLESSGLDPGLASRVVLRAEDARFCTKAAIDYGRLALEQLEGSPCAT